MAKIKLGIDKDKISGTVSKTVKGIGEGAAKAGKTIEKAGKNAAEKAKENKLVSAVSATGEKVHETIDNKLPDVGELRQKIAEKVDINSGKADEIDNELQLALSEYNEAYEEFASHGEALFANRQKAIGTLEDVENLVNSISNRPKSFDKEVQQIAISRDEFKEVYEIAAKEVELDIATGRSIGAGIASGVAFTAAAPATAMWVATTFGTASTGVAISSLAGAAQTSAALAWLGGGALAAGGGGMTAGSALLALAGPVGIGIVGAAAVTSVGLRIKKQLEIADDKKKETERILANTLALRKTDVEVTALLNKTTTHRERLIEQYEQCKAVAGRNYLSLSEDEQYRMGALVNNALSLASSLSENVEV